MSTIVAGSEWSRVREMEANCTKLTEKILQLTLEIIYLLTGEENKNIVVKKPSEDGQDLIMVSLRSLLIPESNNEQQILEVTQKIIDLLMRESENCRHFNFDVKEEIKVQKEDSAMKEQKCLEGHKEAYEDAMMASQPALTSPDVINKRKRPTKCPRPLYSRDSTMEDHTIPRHAQEEGQMGLQIMVKEEAGIRETDNQRSIKKDAIMMTVTKEESSVDVSPGGQDGWTTPEECFILSARYNKDDNDTAQCSPVDFEKFFIQNSPQRIHNREKRFWCSLCDKSFVNKSGLVQHLRIHAGVRPFSCSVCGKSFIEKSQLNRHHRVHTGEKPFSCPICGKCFNDKGNREKHVKTHTAGGQNVEGTPEGCLILSPHSNKDDNEMAECPPEDFEKLFIQNSPPRIHVKEKRFWCSMCDKSFVNKSGLVQHLRIHAGVRPFCCAVCGKSFIEKSQLNRHQRVHTDEKPFPCPICGKCFNDKGNREKHVRTHTGEKPFSCSDCGKRFAQNVTLGLHKRKHCTGDHCESYGGVSETESLSVEQLCDTDEAV